MIALVDHERRGQRTGHRALDRLAAAVADGDALARQHRPIAVLEIEDRVGERRERDGVGAHEHLAVAEPDGERAALAGHDHQILVAAEDHGERERALEMAERVVNRGNRIFARPHLARDEMRDHFGVGVGGKLMTAGKQLCLELGPVFDDSVVDHGDAAAAVRVRVGVLRGG